MAPDSNSQQSRIDSEQSGSITDYLVGQLGFAQNQHEAKLAEADCSRSRDSLMDIQIKTEPSENSSNDQQQLLGSSGIFFKQHQRTYSEQSDADNLETENNLLQQQKHQTANSAAIQYSSSNYETKSESGSSDVLSRPQTPNSVSATHSSYSMNELLLGQQLDSLPLGSSLGTALNLNNMGPPKKFQLNKVYDKNSPSSQFDTNSNSSNSSSTSGGKRANRTRFTDYQIKVLQEFFENNSYPKDSDLEYLSKLLLLSPRVIVVWFQVIFFFLICLARTTF